MRTILTSIQRDMVPLFNRHHHFYVSVNIPPVHGRYENLTPREREVLAHVVSGKLNKQIAFDLGAAERTIKAHRASIMAKLGVQSVAELARLAQELGIQPMR
jgi:FixJ family two-component response regulator